jgi:hypothetical protein
MRNSVQRTKQISSGFCKESQKKKKDKTDAARMAAKT